MCEIPHFFPYEMLLNALRDKYPDTFLTDYKFESIESDATSCPTNEELPPSTLKPTPSNMGASPRLLPAAGMMGLHISQNGGVNPMWLAGPFGDAETFEGWCMPITVGDSIFWASFLKERVIPYLESLSTASAVESSKCNSGKLS
jgi:hypothetical protein